MARVAAEALVVLAVALAYLGLFRTYGFDVVDEGTQLAQIDRVAHGARPYLDFETGYTPWYFTLHVALWQATGAGIVATRTFGVLLHALTVALVYAALRRRASALLAASVAAFDVAFLLPVSPRAGAPFNIPYPGWIAAPLALGAQLLASGVVAARAGGPGVGAGAAGVLPLLAAGALAGAAFAVKPNAGLLALGGVALATVAGWRRGDVVAALLGGLVRLGAVAGALALLGVAAHDPAYVVALLVPVLAAALRGAPLADAGPARPVRDLIAVAAGFLVPTAVWALPLLHTLGAARFAREVLLLDGGGVVGAYLLPFPAPAMAAAGLLAAILLLAVLARRAHGAARGGGVAAPAVLLAGLAFAAAASGAQPARIVGEEVCLWLGPVALAAAIVLLPRGVPTARLHALLAFAAVWALQLFPRPDLIHVAMGGPPLLLAVGAAWSWLGAPLRAPRDRRARLANGAAIAVLLLACVARTLPGLRARLVDGQAPLDAGARAPLTIATRFAGEHAWLGEAVRAIDARTAAGEEIFTFPDLAGLAFLADRPAPFFYLYFVPGRPDLSGEQRTIDELERRRPRVAVTGHPRVPAFAAAESYFARLGAYLDERYPAVETLAGCTLRVRGDAPR
jgi:hypothetical protein